MKAADTEAAFSGGIQPRLGWRREEGGSDQKSANLTFALEKKSDKKVGKCGKNIFLKKESAAAAADKFLCFSS